MITIGFVVASLKYDSSIPLAKSNQEGYELAWISIGLAAISAVLIGVMAVFGEQIVLKLFALESMAALPLWVAAGVFGGAVLQAINTVCIRQQTFQGLAISKASAGLLLSFGQAGLGLAGFKAVGLLLADVVSRILAVVPSISPVWSEFRGALQGLTISRLKRSLATYWQFPAYMLPASLMNILSTQGLLLCGPKYFSLAETGAFFLAYRSLYLPGSLLATAVSQVFFGKLAATHGRGEKATSTFAVLLSLLAAGTPVYLGIWTHGLHLFPLIFGAEWDLAGAYAFLMSPYLLLWLPATATSSVLLVNRRFRASLMVNFLHLSLTAAGISWGIWRKSFFESVIALSLLSVFLYLFGLCWFARISGVSLKALARSYINSSLRWNLASIALQFLVSLVSRNAGIALWIIVTPGVLFLSMKGVRSEVSTMEASLARHD